MFPMMRRLGALSVLCGMAGGKPLLDPMKHDVFPVTASNFDVIISKFRNDQVAVVMFYDKSPASRKSITGDYNDLAKQLKGQIKVAAMDCDANRAFCEKSGVTVFPTAMVYPTNPQPPYPFTGPPENLPAVLMSLIPDKVKKLETIPAHDEFLAENLAVPKVLLFSNKAKTPAMFRALSNSFKDRLSLGVIQSSNEALVKKYNVSKFPTVLIVKAGGNVEKYSSTQKIQFTALHDWLNVRSETFVKGGGFSEEGRAEDARVWLVQKIPELTVQSHQDVCFKKTGDMCVVYLVDGPISDGDIGMLEEQREKSSSHGERGVNYRWMWLNMASAPEWKTALGINSFPSVIVINPKKLRWTAMDNHEPKLQELLGKIGGGDARFKPLKGGKIPELPQQQQKESATATRDEL